MNNFVLAPNWGFGAWEVIAVAFLAGIVIGCMLMAPRWYEAEKTTDELERERVRHAACLSIAEGWGLEQMPKKGEWAWSPALQAVFDLRTDFDEVMKLHEPGFAAQLIRRREHMDRATEGM